MMGTKLPKLQVKAKSILSALFAGNFMKKTTMDPRIRGAK